MDGKVENLKPANENLQKGISTGRPKGLIVFKPKGLRELSKWMKLFSLTSNILGLQFSKKNFKRPQFLF